MIKDILHYIAPYRQKFLLGTFIRVTSDIVWLYPVWAISEVINFATKYTPGQSLDYFWFLMISVWVVAVYHFIAHDLCKYFIYSTAEKVSIDAQLQTLRHMTSLDSQWHERENSGNKIKKITRGGESLNRILRVFVDMMIESSVNIVGVVFFFLPLGIEFVAVFLFFFVTYYALSRKLSNIAATQANKVNIQWEEFDGVLFETVNNIRTVKSLGIVSRVIPYLEKISTRLFSGIKRRITLFRRRGIALNLYQEFFRQAMILYTVLGVLNGTYEVGVIAMVLLYFGKIRASAQEFSTVYNEFILSKIAVARMKDILNEKPIIEQEGSKKFHTNWKQISIKDLNFSYHGTHVLKDLNVTINKGEKVGIVGISGAGKSTLFKLLLKLYQPTSGEITFDNTALKDINRESYIPHIAVVPQETELFNFSLKENIAITGETQNIKHDLLEKALEVSHVKDFTHKLTEGAETLIGEKGIKLSGGEKQRVGIARAVYKNPDILLLDEATSHLDAESEQKIQDALHTFFKGITAIVIAHRLSTLKEMDRIIVIKDGRKIEEGSFEQLLKDKGEFQQLWERQKV